MNTDIIWSNLLNQFKDDLASLAYETWFKDTKLYKIDNGKATIIVPMPIHKKHLLDNYSSKIINTLFDITNSNYDLDFLLEEEIIVVKESVVASSNEGYLVPSRAESGHKIWPFVTFFVLLFAS